MDNFYFVILYIYIYIYMYMYILNPNSLLKTCNKQYECFIINSEHTYRFAVNNNF